MYLTDKESAYLNWKGDLGEDKEEENHGENERVHKEEPLEKTEVGQHPSSLNTC